MLALDEGGVVEHAHLMCSPIGKQRECAPPRRGEARPGGVRARTGNGGASCRRGCDAVLARQAAYTAGCVGAR